MLHRLSIEYLHVVYVYSKMIFSGTHLNVENNVCLQCTTNQEEATNSKKRRASSFEEKEEMVPSTSRNYILVEESDLDDLCNENAIYKEEIDELEEKQRKLQTQVRSLFH